MCVWYVIFQKSHVFSQKSQVFTLAFWRCSIFNGICYSTTTVETATFPRRYRLYLNIYNRFHSKRYNSEIHLSEKLKMVSRNPNQTTISIWIWTARYRRFRVSRFGGFLGRSIFSGICYSTTTVETATFPRRYRLYLNTYYIIWQFPLKTLQLSTGTAITEYIAPRH